MTKAVIKLGYDEYVMDLDKALLVAQAMAEAERFTSHYIPSEQRAKGDPSYTYHIWAQEVKTEMGMTIQLVPDNIYNFAKLAGKPPRD